MALFKGRLFAGALFAGALLSGPEVVVEPPVQQAAQVRQGGRGSGSSFDEGGSSWAQPGHTWVKLHRVVRYGGVAPPVEAQVSCGGSVSSVRGVAGYGAVTSRSEVALGAALAQGTGGVTEVRQGSTAAVEAGGVRDQLVQAPAVKIEFIDVDEFLALMVA